MVLEFIPGLMEISILAFGKMENSMEKEDKYKLMGRIKKVSGRMAKKSNELTKSKMI